MSFLELVKKRRSCRKYLPKPMPKEAINRCLEAARLAPSACNSQPWHFIVVEKAELRDRFVKEVFSGLYSMNSFVKDAAAFLVAIRESSTYFAKLGGHFRGTHYNLIDIGIACEHFVLQAEEEGLGTCWLGWFNERAVKKILNLPRGKKIDIIISIGYPADTPLIEKRRKSLAEISDYT